MTKLIKYLAVLLIIIYAFSIYNIEIILFIAIDSTIILLIIYFMYVVLTDRCENIE